MVKKYLHATVIYRDGKLILAPNVRFCVAVSKTPPTATEPGTIEHHYPNEDAPAIIVQMGEFEAMQFMAATKLDTPDGFAKIYGMFRAYIDREAGQGRLW